MTSAPAVSIVIPAYNDELWIAAALQSCVRQSLANLEVIVVDDASTDGTVRIVESFAARDSRIRVISLPVNSSAFEARRAGVEAAASPYVLFLDGDDELALNAAQVALARAQETGADVVGFGVEFVMPEGVNTPAFEAALQPTHDRLSGPAILSVLLAPGETAQGHIWRYLFAVALVRGAYADLPRGLHIPRANDLPVTFLTLARATSYASTPELLYRYFFRRGTSGHRVTRLGGFTFYLGAVASIELVGSALREASAAWAAQPTVTATYESARLSIIGNLLRYIVSAADEVQGECLALLRERVGEVDVIRAASGFCRESLPMLARAAKATPRRSATRKILLSSADLSTGGIQAVLVSQAQYLLDAGFDVTIAVHRPLAVVHNVPAGIDVVRVEGELAADRLSSWIDICRDSGADVIIEHHVLYNRHWPYFALAASTLGIPTIGWLHNFALRPAFDDNENTTFLVESLPLLETVVTLSPTDVAFWKLRGITNVVYLPNPPSPMLLGLPVRTEPLTAPSGPVKLVWWGRLQQSTKRVRSLIALTAALRERGVDARLSIIGPETPDLTSARLLKDAVASGVVDAVQLHGALHGQALIDEVSTAHFFVSTSAIEGYLLTLVEAQAIGLPVAMFELPWLSTVHGNDGVVTARQGDIDGLARAIAELVNDPARYAASSRASLAASRRAVDHDFGDLYRRLLAGDLPPEFSPEPSLDDARLLLEWSTLYIEANSKRHRRQRKEISALQAQVAKFRSRLAAAQRRNGRLRRLARRFANRAERTVGPILRRPTATTKPASPQPQGAAASATTVSPIDVTVVIPVYNSEAWLEQCVSSVLNQTGVALEVICINDGATDGSRDLLASLAGADARVRIIDQANSGQSVGRNVGLDAARGRYVIYLDSDDYWSLDALAALVRRADEDQLDVLLLEGHAFRDEGVPDALWARYATYYPRSREYGDVRTGVEMMFDTRTGRDYRVQVGLYLARTEYVRRIKARFIPDIVHQDNPYTFALLLDAERTAHSLTDLYARRLRGGSTITTLQTANSAKGYYVSYVAMTRQLARRSFTAEVTDVLTAIVHDVFRGVRDQFVQLPPSIGDELKDLDPRPDAQLAFRVLRSSRDDRPPTP